MSERIVVDSFDGLFDENAKALSCDINYRKYCCLPKHLWINASLRWESPRRSDGGYWSIDFESRKGEPGWGNGYGGIRFCERCKIIDCIHIWDDHKTYVVEYGKFLEQERQVSHCRICHRRIARGGCRSCKPSSEANALIDKVMEEMGKPSRWLPSDLPRIGPNVQIGSGSQHYGSGYMCELPVAVSQILDQAGEDAARAFIKSQFGKDGCDQAMRIVQSMAR